MLQMCCDNACKLRGNISSDALDVLKGIMPEKFKHLVCKCEGSADNLHALVRATVYSREDAEVWKQSFNESSHTTLRVLRTKPPVGIKVLFKMEYKCQHKTQPRSSTANCRRGSKNTDCPATVKVTVYRTERTRHNGSRRAPQSADVHLQEFPALIEIRFCHNHPINAPFVLKHRDVSEATRLKIQRLLFDGHRPTEALEMFKMNLQSENPETYADISCDRAQCPDLSYVYRLYYKLFKEGCRERFRRARSPQLRESVNSNFDHSATVKEEDESTENSEQTEPFTSAGCTALSAAASDSLPIQQVQETCDLLQLRQAQETCDTLSLRQAQVTCSLLPSRQAQEMWDSLPLQQAQGTCDSPPLRQTQTMCAVLSSRQAQEIWDSLPLRQAQATCDSLPLRQAQETCSLFADLEECVTMLKEKVVTDGQYFTPALATFIRKFRVIKSNSHLVRALITFGDSHGISLPVGVDQPVKSADVCGLKRPSDRLYEVSSPKRIKGTNTLSECAEKY